MARMLRKSRVIDRHETAQGYPEIGGFLKQKTSSGGNPQIVFDAWLYKGKFLGVAPLEVPLQRVEAACKPIVSLVKICRNIRS